MSAKLENAKALYMEGIRDGRPREATAAYTGARYTQHSTGVADGVEGFIEFFESFLERNPKRDIQVVRAIEDGRYVFVHAYQSLGDGEHQWVTADLFDTDEDDKLIEHWDVIAAFEGPGPSGNSQVDGETEIRDLDQTDANKATVRLFMTEVLQNRDFSRFDEYIAEDLIQHGIGLHNGRVACRERIEEAQEAGAHCECVFKLIGQGNIVVSYSKSVLADDAVAVFNIWRLSDSRIVEHWSVAEAVPPREEWANSGKF